MVVSAFFRSFKKNSSDPQLIGYKKLDQKVYNFYFKFSCNLRKKIKKSCLVICLFLVISRRSRKPSREAWPTRMWRRSGRRRRRLFGCLGTAPFAGTQGSSMAASTSDASEGSQGGSFRATQPTGACLGSPADALHSSKTTR